MGSDVSVVLHPEAAVPDVVITTQRKAPTSPAGWRAPTVVRRCPAVRVLQASAAEKLAGGSSASTMTSTADLHPLDQPVLLIRNCAELDAFTKSRTYLPVLRAIHAHLEERDRQAASKSKSGVSGSSSSHNHKSTFSRPVCPIGLIFDSSLALGGRLTTNESRAACAQNLKLFFVHLIAALEYVQESDDAGHTKWPSSPGVQALREGSAGSASASQSPRLSLLYLDLRASAMDDAVTRWFATSVILRAVRRARPFMLVSARGRAAGVGATGVAGNNYINGSGSSSSGNEAGGGDTFLNYYSPDVKADMIWASLQHILLTENSAITPEGARVVLEELLTTDATREVMLRQQGVDPKAQRAQAVAAALTSDRLAPCPDSQLLPQLYLVDILRQPVGSAQTQKEAEKTAKSSTEGLSPSAQLESTVRSAKADLSTAASTPSAAAAAAAVAASIPPSPQLRPPQPTARTTNSTPAPATQNAATVTATTTAVNNSVAEEAANHQPLKPHPSIDGEPGKQEKQPQSPRQKERPRNTAAPSRPLPQLLRRQSSRMTSLSDLPATITLKTAPVSARKGRDAVKAQPAAPAQRVVRMSKRTSWVSTGPSPSHCSDPGVTSPPPSFTPRAEAHGRQPLELDRDAAEAKEEEERLADAEVDLQNHSAHETQAYQTSHHGQQNDEEPWLDHAYPIKHGSHQDSARPQRSSTVHHRNGVINTPRSARRRSFDIAALDSPEEPYVTAAAKVSPTMWEEGVRKRHETPAEVAARRERRSASAHASRSRFHGSFSTTARGSGGLRHGADADVQPRTGNQRSGDSVAAAKAAYEAATLAEQRAQQRRQRQHREQILRSDQVPVRGASLRVEGEVQSVHDTPFFPPTKADIDVDGGDVGNSSPSPAPNRPNGVHTPSSLTNTPLGRAAGTANGGDGAPQPTYSKRRLSTAVPPAIDPRTTTTSQLRAVTNHRRRRASEVTAEISEYYAATSTPRRDFRGAAVMAAMSSRQPTREEVAAVQAAQFAANDRRQSLGSGYRGDSRRPTGVGVGMNTYTPMNTSTSNDVSNPAMKAQLRAQGVVSPSKTRFSVQQQQQQRWTPACQRTNGQSAPEQRGNKEDSNDSSFVPSLSPWGTADYQGSVTRQDEWDRVSPDGTAAEVNENGVQLVHQVLRTQHRTRY